MTTSSRWADLRPRLISAVVMVALAVVAIWAGGLVFNLAIAVVTGGVIWELASMLWRGQSWRALKLGIVGGVALFLASLLPLWLALPVLAVPVVLGALEDEALRNKYALFAVWTMLAGFGFVWMRNEMGLPWVMWLVLVVVVTDVAGYFAGKIIGGPKFWPRISPKKTWSGTSAGWVASALVGIAIAIPCHFGAGFVILSVLVSMASQAGDVAESALKRQCGVKDSSDMIPGHGGMFDRFDGMMGAALLVLVANALWGL